jgi:PAS domain S-box-containing protein
VRFRRLAELSPDALFVWASGRIRFVNEAFLRLCGAATMQEVLGSDPLRFVPPESRALVQERVERLLAAGRPQPPTEQRWVRLDGCVVVVEAAAAPVPWEGEQALQVVLRDVSERKRAEAGRRFLSDASAILTESLDSLETLERIGDLILERVADACCIDVAAEDGRLERVVLLSREPGVVERVRELERRYPTAPDSTAGHMTALRTGEARLYAALPDETLAEASRSDEHLALWRALRMESALAVPLVARGRTRGVLTLVSHSPERRFDETDLELAGELANRIAIAVDNARLYLASQAEVAERRRAEAVLRRLGEAALAITRQTSIQAVLETITGQARAIVEAHQAVTSLTVGDDWEQAISAVSLSEKYAAWRDYGEMPDGSGIYAPVSRVDQPMRLTQAELEAHPAWRAFGSHASRHPPLRGWLAAPLVGREGENIGLIQLSDRVEGEFSAADEAALVQLAQMASAAVENVRLFERAEAERAEAEAANRSKAEFLAAMSHELRTPLNAIAGYTDLMEMGLHGPITEGQARALERIGRSQRYLLALINDILNYAKLDAGQVRFEPSAVPLRTAMAGVEELVAYQIQAKGLVYEGLLCDTDPAVHADPEKLRQILVNLLTNAAKFTEPGGRIWVECREAEGLVAVEVHDTGIGIPREKQATIFDPFVQVGRRLDRPGEGVGLGLAISRDLAHAMGGDLTVESEPGRGSVFTLTLPPLPAGPA